jgi:hypothetical protein
MCMHALEGGIDLAAELDTETGTYTKAGARKQSVKRTVDHVLVKCGTCGQQERMEGVAPGGSEGSRYRIMIQREQGHAVAGAGSGAWRGKQQLDQEQQYQGHRGQVLHCMASLSYRSCCSCRWGPGGAMSGGRLPLPVGRLSGEAWSCFC